MPLRNKIAVVAIKSVESPVMEGVTRVAAPLREQVVASLTQAILNHRLGPGDRLVERELIESLGVSRTTIREAIRELASHGLVTVQPQRGAIVAAASFEDAGDLYEIRRSLETLAVRRFIDRTSDEQVDRLAVAVLELQAVATSDADPAAIMGSRDRFYAALFEGMGSPIMQQMIESIQARVRILCASSLSESGRSEAAAAELHGVVEAIRQRDAVTAVVLMSTHIECAAAATLRTLDPSSATR